MNKQTRLVFFLIVCGGVQVSSSDFGGKKRISKILELELQVGISCRCWELDSGTLQERYML